MSTSDTAGKSKPVAKGQVGNVHWAVWDNGGFFKSTFECRYKDSKDNSWKTTESYSATDALELAEAAREAAAECRKRRQADAQAA